MPNSTKIYQDSERFAALTQKSTNVKTGDMEQLAILSASESPEKAVKSGQDTVVCGDCPLRSKSSGGSGLCYVNTGQGPREVYKAIKLQPVTMPKPSTKPIRLGSYGDPALLPFRLVRRLTKGRRWTGYTHQWHKVSKIWSRLLMASIDDTMAKREGLTSAQLRDKAKAKGYRTFRVVKSKADLLEGEIMCPNYTTGVQCVDCGLCNGAGTAKDIAIVVHGASKKLY